MLSFDIRSLEQHAASVDDQLPPDDRVWQEGDPVPSRPLQVTGRLSSAGAGRFYWHGRIEGDATLPCRRCLADTTVHVSSEEHIIFAEAGDAETDDPDVFPLDPRERELDLRPAIREQWLLSAPSFTECRPDCRGLCPTCGADLNVGQCDCPRAPADATDTRWNALRELAGTGVPERGARRNTRMTGRNRNSPGRKKTD
ncbi:MAG TPA: DUF177 domain-containing protein [Gemmatimonadaceae bacterium]|nr:DUF177 domain-containing protein [Gemmatimonadaceae bacterium]